jgi:hypothetical protein
MKRVLQTAACRPSVRQERGSVCWEAPFWPYAEDSPSNPLGQCSEIVRRAADADEGGTTKQGPSLISHIALLSWRLFSYCPRAPGAQLRTLVGGYVFFEDAPWSARIRSARKNGKTSNSAADEPGSARNPRRILRPPVARYIARCDVTGSRTPRQTASIHAIQTPDSHPLRRGGRWEMN